MSLEKEITEALAGHPDDQWYRFSTYVKRIDGAIQTYGTQLESVNKDDFTACHKYFEKKN